MFGEDDFSLNQELKRIREGISSKELRDANTTVLQGSQTSLQELSAACDTVPFLAEKRLVIVEGLLASVEPRRDRGGRSRPTDNSLAKWSGLVDYLEQMAPTTDLVFLEGAVQGNNRLLSKLKQVATVKGFSRLRGQQLRQWIERAVSQRGGAIDQRAAQNLADVVGGNLWILDGEVEKLCLYAGGRAITEEDVRSMVAPAREASIFAAVDAVIEGRPAVATEFLNRLLLSGATVPYVLTMLARQVRLLILSKELRRLRVPQKELATRLGLSADFVLRKTMQQERRFSFEQLKDIHARLLETDMNIKRGVLEDSIALDLLVVQLCDQSKAARASGSPPLL